jgi:hypothetical protein
LQRRDIGFSIAAYPGPRRKSSAAALLFLLFAATVGAARMMIGLTRAKSLSDFALHQLRGISKDLSQKFGSSKSTDPSGERPQ